MTVENGAVLGEDGLLRPPWAGRDPLLREYYDPMYAYQRDSKAERILFAGDEAAVVAYLREAR